MIRSNDGGVGKLVGEFGTVYNSTQNCITRELPNQLCGESG